MNLFFFRNNEIVKSFPGFDPWALGYEAIRLDMGGGIYTTRSSPVFANLIISENSASFGGGGVTNIFYSSPIFTNVTISGNTGRFVAGMDNSRNSSPILTNVTISGNKGLGMNNGWNSSPILTNVLISGNRYEYIGAGMLNSVFCDPILTNVTISGNSSNNISGIINDSSSHPIIRNSIIFGNIATGRSYDPELGGWVTIHNMYGTNNSYSYCYNSLIERNYGVGGLWDPTLGVDCGGNLPCNADPFFMDAVPAQLVPTTAGDYRLRHCSPCINAGYNPYYSADSLPKLSDITTDLDGNPRIAYDIVDLGAYEYQFPQTLANMTFSNDTVLCEGDTVEIHLGFTGTPPWQFVYTKDNWATYDTVSDIWENSLTWKSYYSETTVYYFVSVADNVCERLLKDVVLIKLVHPNFSNRFSNDTLCSGIQSKRVSFSGSGNFYQWYASGDSITGLPDSVQSGDFGEYTLLNKGGSLLTARITVTPYYVISAEHACVGSDTSFSVTVFPEPTLTTLMANDTLCDGALTQAVQFIGNANHYQWHATGSVTGFLPIGVQSGHFGTYFVENKSDTLTTSQIYITPQYIMNGKTCTEADSQFSITVYPDPNLQSVLPNQVLCDGEQTSAVVFSGNANVYEWMASGSISGLPAGVQTDNFGEYTLENKEDTALTSRITITPSYIENGKTCIGRDANFSITVSPVPRLTNLLENDTLCDGEQTQAVEFSGNATLYEWYVSGAIANLPTGVQSGDFGNYLLENTGDTLLTSHITLTPKYIVNGKTCVDTDSYFSITVYPAPTLHAVLPDQVLCYGEQTSAVEFSGNANGYQWTATDSISGLPAGVQTGDFGEYTLENQGDTELISRIIIIPSYTAEGKTCIGTDTNFSITVFPVPRLTNVLENDTLCDGELSKRVEFSGNASLYEWQVSGTITSFPSGVQSGDFDQYLVENKGDSLITSRITITPKYILNGKTCVDTDSYFSITVYPAPTLHAVLPDQILCHGEQTSAVEFSGNANLFQWTATANISGLPTGLRTGNFGEYILENKDDTVLTSHIIITPNYIENGKTCIGSDTNFSITVFPVPRLLNVLENDTLCDGELSKRIEFSGNATLYEWYVSGAVIGLPTGVQNGDFDQYLVENKGDIPITSRITITPKYVMNGKTCVDTNSHFSITVYPIPLLNTVLQDEVLCDGEQTSAVEFSGNANRFQWTATGTVSGLPAGMQTGNFGTYTVSNQTANNTQSVIEVMPIYTTERKTCEGRSEHFDIVVYPATQIRSFLPDDDLSVCGTEPVRMEVEALGKDLAYQWYYKSMPLQGAQNNYYELPSVSLSNSGTYYVMVSGACGNVRSRSITIGGNINILMWEWDEIIIDNSTRQYYAFQWYRDGVPIAGATGGSYQEKDGLHGCYSVEITLYDRKSIVYSCERCFDKTKKYIHIYPNLTQRGNLIKVRFVPPTPYINFLTVELYNAIGQLIWQQQINKAEFEIETAYLASGVYVLKITTEDYWRYKEKLIVY